VQARLDAGDDVGVHAVADHAGALGVRADLVERRAEHHRVGLADDVRLLAGGLRDEREHRARRGQHALRARARRMLRSRGCCLLATSRKAACIDPATAS
jgi:hypothetical protein